MKIVYRDKLGYVVTEADGEITISEGFAIFDSDDHEVKITLDRLCFITNE